MPKKVRSNVSSQSGHIKKATNLRLSRSQIRRRTPVVLLERMPDHLLRRRTPVVLLERMPDYLLRRRTPVVLLERMSDELLRRVVAEHIDPPSSRSYYVVPPLLSPVLSLESLDGESTSQRAPPLSDIVVDTSSSDVILTPTPVANRSRAHATVPHRVTYKKAIISNVDIDAVEVYQLGALNAICPKCGAIFFQKEHINRQGQRRSCCTLGEVVLPLLRSCPAVLKNYMTQTDHSSVEFRNNIRALNSTFAMASFKTNIPNDRNVGQGNWSFWICGQIYHYTEALPATQELERPILNQYYFVDAADAIDRRAGFLSDRVGRATIENIENMLRMVNPLVLTYHTMRDVMQQKRQEGMEVGDMVLAFKDNMSTELRNYNLPESRSDVAALFCGEDPPFDVDLAIYPRSREANRELKNLNKLADPMVYPLLFPYGEYGYDMSLKYATRPSKTVSIREFYRYRLQIRKGFSILHNAEKLFQQYVVDAWCKAEANELWWLRNNQAKLRLAGKQAVERLMRHRVNDQNLRIGSVVVLPTTFGGGPKAQTRKYLDAMTIVSRLGKPDLFITMTCNPRWQEIVDNLEHVQMWQHRPDLVVRVFHQKLLEFIDDINNKQVYGVILYSMYVIEFQKRGLPHAHILVALRPEDKPDSEEMIDSIVCACIPDPVREPRLHGIVAESYVHRPCGIQNPNASCMKDGKCTKGYPKAFVERTIMNNEHLGQPIYKRPNDGNTILINGTLIDSRRIVPYNRYAASKFQCHINFEICGSLRSIKYLHKYVHKGPDCATVQITDNTLNWDEIRSYLDCRYVSAMEAAWRLFEFQMSDRTHSVLVLPVHLPGEQLVLFDEHDNVNDIENAVNKPTKLMAYFQLNLTDTEARLLKYVEIPENYTWDSRAAQWQRRRQVSKMFGCIAEVSPGELDRFFLRMLLSHVRGATSFEQLRTVDGHLHDSFRDACVALGLLSDEDIYNRCLEEAALNRFPSALRKLFGLLLSVAATYIAHIIPNMWLAHRSHLIEDFVLRGLSDEAAEANALHHIATILARNGNHTLEEFGLPSVNVELLGNVQSDNGESTGAFNNFQGDTAMLNAGQQTIYDHVMAAVEDDTLRTKKIFYIDAPGGTGKTFLFNTIIKDVHHRCGKNCVAVAWTGIAASLLLGGKTAHSAFRLPLNITETSRAGIHVESPQAILIKNAALLIWDEASMAHRKAVEIVDRFLQDLMHTDVPMGGKVMLFGGDFRQILPVVPRAHRTEIVGATLKASILWTQMRHFRLSENVRAGTDEVAFADWLLRLGDGRLEHVNVSTTDPHVPIDLVEIPQQHLLSSRLRLMKTIFGRNFELNAANRAILCPTNASVWEINKQILTCLPGDIKTYFSVDEYGNDENDELHVPVDYINSVKIASLPPHELQLKIGAVVMLLRNLDIDMGQCNGSRLKVVSLGENIIQLELLTGTHTGDMLLLPRINMQATDPSLPKPISRFQFPITLAFAMTINKSQGQTFRKVGIYLEKPCFAHGQLYVAFSRVGSAKDAYIYIENTSRQGSFKFRNRKFTRNVVYESIVDSNLALLPPRSVEDEEDATIRYIGSLDGSFGETWPSLNIDGILDDLHRTSDMTSALNDDPPITQGDEDPAARLLIPQFNTQQLADRVATTQRAGTTGAYLYRNPPRPRYDSDSSSDD